MKVFAVTRKLIISGILSYSLIGCQGDTGEKTSTTNPPPTPVATKSANSATNSSTTNTSGKANVINVQEKEMAIVLSSNTVTAGPVNFVIKNIGAAPHELVVFKTDLPIDKLPLKGEKLDEAGAGLKNVADTGEKELKPGETKTIQANLTPGKYVIICNVGNHFKQGMKIPFTVQ